MTTPTVCAIMLTRDRPAMARQAVECFRRQTYENKLLLVYDTGDPSWFNVVRGSNQMQQWTPQGASHATIGSLRNSANNSCPRVDIFVHWDDDDLSHPNRIAEQVALLQSSGAECVGYNEVLFWRRTEMHEKHWSPGAAWLYSVANPAWVIGSSLCYWREVWQRHPFPDLPKNPMGSSEDVVWRRGVKCHGESSVSGCDRPRLICRIHGSNTMAYEIEKYPDTWRRVPQWDEAVREIVEESK